MENKPLSLLELNSLVRRSITSCLPDEYWVQAELSDVRVNYSGHCYLEFVQKDATGNALLAKHEELYGQMSLPAYGVILSGKQGRPSFQA